MLGEAKLDEFSAGMVGKNTSVLFEKTVDGYAEGYSSNYLRVKVKTDIDLQNEIRQVRLTEYVGGKLVGEFIN